MLSFNKTIRIGRAEISETSPVYIIAEAGVNHGGDMDLAFKLVDIAAKAGADAVKFQAFRTESLILKDIDKASYQKETTGSVESQYDMLKRLELRREHYRALKDYCDEKGIEFLITPFDEKSLDELDDLGLAAYKVASTDTTNIPFLKKMAKRGRPLILSTGMSYFSEVKAVLRELHRHNRDVILLQCTANYPIRDNEANLNVLNTFREHFDIIVGYSDHSTGIGAAPYSVPLGAKVIEKHFTVDKGMEGPDHSASLDPGELKELVARIRDIETYLGSPEKKPTESELGTRKSLQKCLVAARDIRKGEKFSDENVAAKRTGGIGISPIEYKQVLGKKAKKDYKENDIITL